MKAKVLVESSTGVHGLFVRVETEGRAGIYESTHIANYNNGSGLARINAALDWAKERLREREFSVGEVSYNTEINEFEIEVTKVQKKPKVSEIREALRPFIGDAADAPNVDIYFDNLAVEFYGADGKFPVLGLEEG